MVVDYINLFPNEANQDRMASALESLVNETQTIGTRVSKAVSDSAMAVASQQATESMVAEYANQETTRQEQEASRVSAEGQRAATFEKWTDEATGLEAQFNNAINGVTIDTEVINARGGYITIGNRLDALSELTYLQPLVTLSINPSTTIKEYGDNISSITLVGSATKKSLNIEKIELYRGTNLLSANSTPNVNGDEITYIENEVVSDTTTFKTKVYDSKKSVESAVTINYVYPIFAGSVANSNPTEAQIKSLSKLVKLKGATVQTFTTDGGRFVFAYPASYGALTSILDPNGFETIGSYDVTTVNVTGLNGTAVAYMVYTLSTQTTQVNFTNTFKY